MGWIFDTGRLAAAVKAKRGVRSLRGIHESMGGSVSVSTLSRIESGCAPDMETLLSVCDWLGVSPATFFHGGEERTVVDIPGAIRDDERIDYHTREVLAVVVEAAYREFGVCD